jgi:AAA domain
MSVHPQAPWDRGEPPVKPAVKRDWLYVASDNFATTAKAVVGVKGVATFLAEYKPISYTIDGILPGGSVYGLTAKRGAGKTALLTGAALAVASRRSDILKCEVEKGRVAYVILENPTDFRMKLSVTAFALGIDVQALEDTIAVLDMRLPHAQIMKLLKTNAAAKGPFQLVCYDTFQAGFTGAEFNDNVAVLKHTANIRQLTTLQGTPSVLVACHPVKNPSRDNLEPYGGGATMNELDGNITLWNDGGTIEMSWNKIRGPEFDPRYFRIEKLGSPEILDNKGRQPQLPILRPVSEQTVEERVNADNDIGRALLSQLFINQPGLNSNGQTPSAAPKALLTESCKN